MLILKLVALLGLLVQPFSEAAPAGTNSGQCPWDPTQQPFSCTLYAKPNPFPGGTGSVYLVNGVTDTNNCYKNPTASTPNNCYQQGAVNAIDKTMKIYSLLFGSTYLGAATLSVKVYIVNEVNAPPFQDVHAVTKDGGGGNCITQISINFPKGGGPRPLPNFQEILAHELYHCVQYALNKPPVRVDDTPVPWGWWYEGTAEWFANIVYPGAKETISYFDPNFSIYNLPIFDPDTAALFFAYMDKAVFNPASVHGWMVNQKYSTSFGNELTRISKDVQLVPAFPGFADAYFDQKISYYNGGLITESLYTNFAPKPINLPTDASYTFQLTLDIVPWTNVVIQFSPDQTNDNGHTTLQYRLDGNPQWNTAAPGQSITIQQAAAGSSASCPTGINYHFMATTTYDTNKLPFNKVHPIISFTVTSNSHKKRDDDPCDNSPSTGDTCLVGDWTLDDASMQAYLTQVEANDNGGMQVTSLTVTGSSTFTVTSSFSSTMTFSDFNLDIDGITGGYNVDTVSNIEGSLIGDIVFQSGNTFSWPNAVTTGNLNITINVEGLGSTNVDYDLDSQYGNSTTVDYTCSGSTLQMIGTYNGQYVWAYIWTKQS